MDIESRLTEPKRNTKEPLSCLPKLWFTMHEQAKGDFQTTNYWIRVYFCKSTKDKIFRVGDI